VNLPVFGKARVNDAEADAVRLKKQKIE